MLVGMFKVLGVLSARKFELLVSSFRAVTEVKFSLLKFAILC